MSVNVTTQKKLYCIAELFNDDLSIISTAIKMTIVAEDHKTILKHIIDGNVERYERSINMIYELSTDHYYLDGLTAIIEMVHKHSVHGADLVRSNVDTGIIIGDDLKKGARLSLFGDE